MGLKPLEFEVNEDVRPESNPVVEDPKESVDPTGTLATSSTTLLLFLNVIYFKITSVRYLCLLLVVNVNLEHI